MTPASKRNAQRAVAKRAARMLGDATLCGACGADHAELGGGVRPVCPRGERDCPDSRTVDAARTAAQVARAAKVAEMRGALLTGAALLCLMMWPLARIVLS